ncbi:MAG TPA: ABC transporter ATP-binding protein [Nitrospirae bacterium]|nr:lipoprotein-releasing system ATP-binding protein LolD [bacterium BMS3Abin10]GBE38768.1 lipoprotein-releasing system ATP-binding protein LolD [bacterium BMS3Bbin08]HDH51400.1 ABC transporter ATP-binding protein [Nitrospirota bacterium]HDK16383.1 ABC transporter ATP-binding protein [Nitrospirota bacterium]HDK81813.1 ABC transporter ATP-binding protein [Nitrospirota bacterium]
MEPLIRIENLNKSFITPGGEIRVLKGINLDLHQGEMAAVMGPSGVGKSTLLHILGALDRATSGKVLYEGNDVFSLGDDELADFRNKKIGFVFQFHHLLPEFNAIENTMMPALIAGVSRTEAYKKAEAILADVGLSNRLTHKPGELSGGEQQRVAVARALILEPGLILADEPTGNLDTRTGEALFSLLLALNKKGTTFLIVTHNEDLALKCGRIIKMLDGNVI